MARVPTVQEGFADVSTQPLADVTQNASATPENMGAAEGRAVAGFGQNVSQTAAVFAQANERVQNRYDDIDRAKKLSEADAQMQASLDETENNSEGGLENPENLRRYHEQLGVIRDRVLQGHQGSGDSRARLQIELENRSFRYGQGAVTKAQAAQVAVIDRDMSEFTGQLSEQALAEPQRLEEIFALGDERLSNYSKSFTPEQMEIRRQGMRETIVSGVVQQQIDAGDSVSARQAIQAGGKYLSPAKRIQLNNYVTKMEYSEAKTQRETTAKINWLKSMGVKITPDIAVAAAGITLPTKMTPAQKIAAFEGATGKPATEEQIAKAYDMDTGSARTSQKERTAEFLASNADEFASGILSPEEDRMFQNQIAMFLQVDPTTGRRNALPPPLRHALRIRGIDERDFIETVPGRNVPAGGASTSDFPSMEAAPSDAGATTAAGGEDLLTPPTVTAPTGGEGASAAPAAGTEGSGSTTEPDPTGMVETMEAAGKNKATGGTVSPQTPAPRITLFDLSGRVAGPVSSLGAGAAATPGVGEVVQAPEIVQARQFAERASQDLAGLLAQTKMHANTEREQLVKRLSIAPSAWNTEAAYKNNLIGLDDYLGQLEQHYSETISGGQVGAKDANDALAALNGIKHFRKLLGVPPLMTPQQAASQPSGTVFRGTDGNFYRKP